MYTFRIDNRQCWISAFGIPIVTGKNGVMRLVDETGTTVASEPLPWGAMLRADDGTKFRHEQLQPGVAVYEHESLPGYGVFATLTGFEERDDPTR